MQSIEDIAKALDICVERQTDSENSPYSADMAFNPNTKEIVLGLNRVQPCFSSSGFGCFGAKKRARLALTLILILAAFPALGLAGDNKGDSTLAMIESRIDNEGAKTVLLDIVSKPEWTAVVNGISKAEPRWIRIGSKLREVSDGGASTEIRLSIAEAIGEHPLNVFANYSLFSDSSHISDVCATTGIETPIDDELDSIEKRISKLKMVKLKRFEKMKKTCLDAAVGVKAVLLKRKSDGFK